MEISARFGWSLTSVALAALLGAACGNSGTPSDASGGASATGGGPGSGGTSPGSGGSSASGGATSSGGSTSGSGGATASGGTGTGGSALGGAGSGDCAAWATADPAAPGPFEVLVEDNVGPLAGVGEDDMPTDFMVFRPAELGTDGHCHPVITWGNGTGSTPDLYGVLLEHLASHGFIVIGSNSQNVGQGDPPPMVPGAQWIVDQNADSSSPYFGHVDTAHVGATGHSQGGFATSMAGRDPLITTMAPLCGASGQGGGNLSGPAFFFCGGMDETVPCDGIHDAFAAVDDQPAMFANYLTADHANWITFFGDTLTPVEVAVTAWMRVHLMGDTALKSWFYGDACLLCADGDWEIEQSMMDQ